MSEMKTKHGKGGSLVWISLIYLLGLFIGAIDSGIITPARTIIQNELGVDASLGIWMITIYTLTYAAIIPISGKLADRKGRKPIYLLSIGLFCLGSLICALSALLDSFLVLMLGRIVQASGAGGIMPIATAEFGTSFPEEKRGMALGLVGAVYGIANVLGASVGSAVLNIFGVSQWQWVFLINVPICLFIVVAGIIVLPNNRADEIKKTDKLGTLLMTVIILSLLYSLKNLDFFNFVESFTTWKVWPFLLLSVVLLPLFVVVERRAEDPIFHTEYTRSRPIMITLALAVVVGCSMMGMIFIPQFAENALRIPTGSGGYFVIILGLCAGGASMMSGKMIDRRGAKIVMTAGFLVTIIGCLYLSFVAVRFVNLLNVIIALVLIGFGLGLTMGTPLNYMMLQHTSDEESNSALATLSLIRSIGTAVAPAIMVGFIVHASAGIQGGIMDILPKEVEMPALPYVQEIDDTLARYQQDPNFSKQMEGVEIPKLSEMTTVEVKMDGDSDYEMPPELLERLQNSDVTTIADTTEVMVRTMFGEMSPTIVANIQSGIQQGIDGIKSGTAEMQKALSEMQEGHDGIGQGIDGMNGGISAQEQALAQLRQAESMLRSFRTGIPQGMSLLDFLPAQAKKAMPAQVLGTLQQIRTSADVDAALSRMETSRASMESALSQTENAITMMERLPDGKVPDGQTLLDVIPAQAKDTMSASALDMLSGVTDVSQLKTSRTQLQNGIAAQQQTAAQLKSVGAMLKSLEQGNLPSGMSLTDFMPAEVKNAMPDSVLQQLESVRSVDELSAMTQGLESGIDQLTAKRDEAKTSQDEMATAMTTMSKSVDEMNTLADQLTEVKAAIPDAFAQAGENYAQSVQAQSAEIEDVFQSTLNVGYRNMYLFLVAVNALGLLLLAFYPELRKNR